jgi:hypothetical protein
MVLTRQDAAYGAFTLVLLFLAGSSAAYAVTVNNFRANAVAGLFSLVTIALILSYIRYCRDTTSPYRLLLNAHKQVAHLTQAGYDMLTPCEEHCETARLLICMEGDNAVIKKEQWRGVWHYYTISPDGEVKREIWEIDGVMTQADQEWLNSPLTPERLKVLVTALRSSYTPRQRVSIAL